MLILRNMMISCGSGMRVLLHPVPLVEKPVAIVHPRPLVQITHEHQAGGKPPCAEPSLLALNSSRKMAAEKASDFARLRDSRGNDDHNVSTQP
jgi:hypothetical protein